jgi:hypothetical protein
MSPEAREHSFDELARGLASSSISRRRALRLMGAALVGGTLGSLGGVAAADEECKPVNKKCRKNHQCCSGNCSKSGTSRSGTCACQRNGGGCTTDSQCCSGTCVSGTCAALNTVDCRCIDGTVIPTCRSVSCLSAEETFAICLPVCESHGGLQAIGCRLGCAT